MKDFSVIIPHLNDAYETYFTVYSYIKELEPFGFDYEIIIVDNGSDVTQLGILASFMTYLPNWFPVRLVSYTEHQGDVPPWQYGVKQAVGKYLVFSDSHILLSSNFFVEQMKLLKADATIKTLYAAGSMGTWTPPFLCGYHFSKEAFHVNNGIQEKNEPYEILISSMGSVIVEREHFLKMGMFGLSCFNETGGFGSEEIFLGLKTWMFGGRCVINPNVFWMHTILAKYQGGKKWPAHNMCIGAYVMGGQEYLDRVIKSNQRVVAEVVNQPKGKEFIESVPKLAKEDYDFVQKNAVYSFNEIMERFHK